MEDVRNREWVLVLVVLAVVAGLVVALLLVVGVLAADIPFGPPEGGEVGEWTPACWMYCNSGDGCWAESLETREREWVPYLGWRWGGAWRPCGGSWIWLEPRPAQYAPVV